MKMLFGWVQVLAKQDVACCAKGCKRREAGVPAGAVSARCGQEPHGAGSWGSMLGHEASHGKWTDGTRQV